MSVLGLDGEVDGEMEGIDGIDGDFTMSGDSHELASVIGEAIQNVIGRRRHHGRHHGLKKPNWRGGQLAPGLQQAAEGMITLPMSPLQNGGVFTALIPSITWQGQLQLPFRAERFICPAAVRNGTSAVGRLLGQFFVGVRLQMGDIFGIDLEAVGAQTLFGGRMAMHQAEPGVLIRIPTTLSQGLTGTDTIFASMFFFGRVVH